MSLPETSGPVSRAGISSLLETIGTARLRLAVREIFCGLWLAPCAPGGDEDRADAMRFRLLAPTAAGGLFEQLESSQSLGTFALCTTGDNLGATPELDLGARIDAFIFVFEVGLAELKSSRTFVLSMHKRKRMKIMIWS